jgi:Putative auto-transporter adhesin, head GIN domain
MKLKNLSFLFLAFVAVFFSSCKKDILTGRGDIVTQERTLNNFTSVKIKGSTDVIITQGAALKVTVSDYSNLVNELETTIAGDELSIRYKSEVLVTRGKSKVTIVMPSLKGLHVNGSGDFTVTGPFTATGTFPLTINGSGDMTVSGLSTDDLNADIAGSGDINLSNSISKNVRVNIEGSGDVKAFGLQCDHATVNVKGSGDTEISVAKQLDAFIKGSGNIYYKGNPSVNVSISGSGKVMKR